MQILVLDDSNVMRSILVKYLLLIGLQENEIYEAHNGADAIRKLQVHTFDLLLLDIIMDGIDGISVLKEARSIQPNARVVMCSSFSESETVKELIDLGINDFIIKPFSEEKLKEILLRNIMIIE